MRENVSWLVRVRELEEPGRRKRMGGQQCPKVWRFEPTLVSKV